ncbi:MAG: hypothetical protein KBG15_06625 [Kofleriaceae bacterium]|nr:hypothetical protein [Kofleriaceae bacterium]
MKSFARAVTTGFALALGAAVFRKVAKKLGLDEKPANAAAQQDNAAAAVVAPDASADTPVPVGN